MKKDNDTQPKIEDVQIMLNGIYENSGIKSNEEELMVIEVESKVQNKMDRYEFADYNAASMVLGALEMIYNDMIEGNGIQYKMLLNDMLAEKQALMNVQGLSSSLTTNNRTTTELATRERKGDLDDIENLMVQI